MKLLHVINNLNLGGAERRVTDAVNGADPGIAVGLACLQARGRLLQELQRRDLSVFDLEASTNEEMFRVIERLASILRFFRPDIVHTHLVQASFVGRLAAHAVAVPVSLTTQHHAFHSKEDTLLYRLERSTWHLSRGFIASSHAIKSYLRKSGYRGRVRVIHTGIAKANGGQAGWRSPARSPLVLAVGQMRDPQKGHDILIKSIGAVATEFPEIGLRIVGDGPEKAGLEALADREGLATKVSLPGECDDVRKQMESCTVFVLASRWEGLGRVLLEAMAAGCPIVATRVEGVPEVITDGHNGLLVPPGDSDSLARAVLRLLRDEKLRSSLSGAARETVRRRFGIDKMLAKEARFYEDLLRGARRRPLDDRLSLH